MVELFSVLSVWVFLKEIWVFECQIGCGKRLVLLKSKSSDRLIFSFACMLGFKFFERSLFESLASVRYQYYCLINLKRKTCLIGFLFSVFIKVCEGLLFALKKENVLLRLCWYIFVWGWILGPLISLISFQISIFLLFLLYFDLIKRKILVGLS